MNQIKKNGLDDKKQNICIKQQRQKEGLHLGIRVEYKSS